MVTTLKDTLDGAGVDTSSLSLLWEDAPDRIYTLSVPGADAIARWRTLRALVSQTGHWPVILGDVEDVETLREMSEYDDGPTPMEIIRQGSALDWPALLTRWRAEAASSDPEGGGEAPHGKWPEGTLEESAANTGENFSIPYDILTGIPKDAVALALIPSEKAWETSAYLCFGGWNDCPPPEEHVCVLKHWQEVYGAEVVGISGAVVEMQVSSPPLTRDAALALASEQYAYCYDIVDQGTQTLENLAATLLNGGTWFFWWD